VKYRAENTNEPSLIFQRVDEKIFGLVFFIPFSQRIQNLNEAEGQGEFIFLLDRISILNRIWLYLFNLSIKIFFNPDRKFLFRNTSTFPIQLHNILIYIILLMVNIKKVAH
jgi:hypothetical protein